MMIEAVPSINFNPITRLTKSAKSRLDNCGGRNPSQSTQTRLAASSTRLFSCLFSAGFSVEKVMSAMAGVDRNKPGNRTNEAAHATLSFVALLWDFNSRHQPGLGMSVWWRTASSKRGFNMSIARPAPVRARKNTAQQKARLSQHPAPDPVFLLGQRFASLIENSPHELPMRPIDAAGLCGEIMLAMSYHQAQSQAGAVVQIRALIYFLNKICRDGTADLADLNVIRRLAHSSLCAVEGSCNLSRESLAGHFMVPLGSNPFMPSFGSIATEKLCEGTTAS